MQIIFRKNEFKNMLRSIIEPLKNQIKPIKTTYEKKLLLISTCITKIAFSHSNTSMQELFSTRLLCLTKADSVLSAHSIFKKDFLCFKH